MLRTLLCVTVMLSCQRSLCGQLVTFGSGDNQFTMEFVPIGDPGNPADASGSPADIGSVPYTFGMGKFEVSEDMISKANADGDLDIVFGQPSRGADKPATDVWWNGAAQFVNWLNTSSGFPPAYKFDGEELSSWETGDAGYDSTNPIRNSLARFVLPSLDEWHKAAYFDARTATYFDFATGSNDPPIAVNSGVTDGAAVYNQAFETGPAAITFAGGSSPYGTVGQGGNVFEWIEDIEHSDRFGNHRHYLRGGSWSTDAEFLLATAWSSHDGPGFDIGFRVASVPEPSTLGLTYVVVGLVTVAGRRCHRRRPATSGGIRAFRVS